jgi:hypothetical protein
MKAILFIALLLAAGCSRREGTVYAFPAGHEAACQEALAYARDCIAGKGEKVRERATKLTVTGRKGEKRFPDGWGWRSAEWDGAWVLGLTRNLGGGRYQIEVVLPASGNVLRHEMGHFWRMSNAGDASHSAKFSSCFWNWSPASLGGVAGKTTGDGGRRCQVRGNTHVLFAEE